MEDTLIGFETAKLAKLKGFVGKWCTTYYKVDGVVGYIAYYEYYDNNEDDNPMVFDKVKPLCEAPTQSLLQKYLRDKHNIHIQIHTKVFHKDKTHYKLTYWCIGLKLKYNPKEIFKSVEDYDTYEECLEYALQQALNLI